MGTASKLQFNLKDLREKAVAIIDGDIAAKQHELEIERDDQAFREEVEAWRSEQEARIEELARLVGSGNIDNLMLSSFKLHPLPKRDPYVRHQLQRDLKSLTAERERMVAKIDTLVVEEDTVSLTRTQLREFFGL